MVIGAILIVCIGLLVIVCSGSGSSNRNQAENRYPDYRSDYNKQVWADDHNWEADGDSAHNYEADGDYPW